MRRDQDHLIAAPQTLRQEISVVRIFDLATQLMLRYG
jgi:hypothetical protein